MENYQEDKLLEVVSEEEIFNFLLQGYSVMHCKGTVLNYFRSDAAFVFALNKSDYSARLHLVADEKKILKPTQDLFEFHGNIKYTTVYTGLSFNDDIVTIKKSLGFEHSIPNRLFLRRKFFSDPYQSEVLIFKENDIIEFIDGEDKLLIETPVKKEDLLAKFQQNPFTRDLFYDLTLAHFPFTNEEILNFCEQIDFNNNLIYKNPNIDWNADLIEALGDKFNFNHLWYLKNLKIDIAFIERFDTKIDFSNLYFLKNIEYSEKLIDKYGKHFDNLEYLLNKDGFTTLGNIRKFSDRINWHKFSRLTKYPVDISFLKEFESKIDWDAISHNPNLKLDLEMLDIFKDKFNFRNLSRNKATAQIILSYPKSEKWNWDAVTQNEGIEINDNNLNLICKYYAKSISKNPPFSKFPPHILMSVATRNVVSKLIQFRRSGLDYLLSDNFKDKFIKHLVSKSSYEFPKEFFVNNLDIFDLTEGGLISKNGKYLSSDFIANNISKFDLSNSQFYYLSLTNEIVEDNLENISFFWLPNCQSINWSWDFIEKYSDKLNIFRLSENQKVFHDLFGNLPRRDVLQIFEFASLIRKSVSSKKALENITLSEIDHYVQQGFSIIRVEPFSIVFENQETLINIEIFEEEYYNYIYLVYEGKEQIEVLPDLLAVDEASKYVQICCFDNSLNDSDVLKNRFNLTSVLPEFLYTTKKLVTESYSSEVLIFKEENILKFLQNQE